MNHLSRKIRERLRTRLVVFLASLLSISILGCAHVNGKNATEIWLIDSKEMLLYRHVGRDTEEVLPIQGNPAMSKFMCVSEEDFSELVTKVMEKADE